MGREQGSEADRMVGPNPLNRTLLLAIALPDVYAEDFTQADADEWWDGDMTELIYEGMALISSTIRVLLATGDKGGNDLHELRGVIVSATARDRQSGDDEPEDERLTDMIERGCRRAS